ncbi:MULTISPECIES: DUF1702 family protein [unclassified Crossiella]|uniref:DUF1702 family protein n=1 Tax=unclassified Crossiella TaxID=2620835 RepID=UPI001FFECECE|nr:MULTISPECIES: DUF1702 family protein [unclassified Crossiella]MCK2244572.1 DUF1702 family protein [Crossiella sp. S99.2]MCK2258203.1 DUF1702 family protein [Crossiella sp. S99.1]
MHAERTLISPLVRLGKRLRRRALLLDPREATLDYRGFAVTTQAKRELLDTVGRSFVHGYNAGVDEPDPHRLAELITAAVPAAYQGFAFEGAAMSYTLLDTLPPGGDRLAALLAGPGRPHRYLVHCGAGWAFARLRLHPRLDRTDDTLLAWLMFDGFGFHQAYFAAPHKVHELRPSPRWREQQRRVFDQGVGRALWFVEGADVRRVAGRIGAFAGSRHADLWAGAGLAATYAGGVSEEEYRQLVELAGPYRPELAQGCCAAATARVTAGLIPEGAERACAVLAERSATQAHELLHERLAALSGHGETPSYQQWRASVQDVFRGAPVREARAKR